MMQLLLYLVVGVLILYFGFARRSVRQRAIRAVAEQLGLEAFDRSLDGELDGYRITTEYVRRGGLRRRASDSLVLEIKLHTVPADLRLQLESTRQNVEGAIHAVDLEVGDRPFDATFFVECDDEAATRAWLGDADRRRALVGLDRWAEAVSLRDRWLEISLASDPLEISELRETVRWLRLVGQRIDSPEPIAVPPPIVHNRSGLSGFALVLFIVPLVLLTLFCVLLAMLLIEKAERDQPEEEPPPVLVHMEPEPTPEPENPFTTCIDALPMTPDVDVSPCAKLLDGEPDMNPTEIAEARQTLMSIELRRVHRVTLDPEQVRLAVENFESIPRVSEVSPRKAAKRYSDERTRRTYDVGLIDDYMDRESFAPDAALPRAAASLDVMLNLGASFAKPRQMGDNSMIEAARCLTGVMPPAPSGRDATEVFVACGEGPVQAQYVRDHGERLAGLERDPARTLAYSLASNRLRRETTRDFQIATSVIELTSPDLVPYKQGYSVSGVARAAYQPFCNTPWTVDNASLDPAVLERAIPDAGPLAPRLRLWAARQHLGLGNVKAMRKQVAAIGPESAEALCAAQLVTAAGDPESALAMLTAIPNRKDIEKQRNLAIAHAQALLGNWEEALEHGRTALELSTHAPDRAAAAIVVAVAAGELGLPDELGELFGPMPDPDLHTDRQAFDHPVLATRWFVRAAMNEDLVEARWLAPAYLPLEPGSEWLQLYVASKLAPIDKMDYWLDSLLSPDGFDPYGLIEGRRMVAKLRGDEQGLKRWTALAAKHRDLVEDVSDLRLVRTVRRLSPGSR